MIIKPNGTLEVIHNNHFTILSDCAAHCFSLNINFLLVKWLFSYHISCFTREDKPSIFTYIQIGDYYLLFDFDYRKLVFGLYWQLDELFVPINLRFN